MMRPVQNREEYIKLRNGGRQKTNVAAVRSGDEKRKSKLVQMNYSCLPNDDGSLKGSTRMSTTVGMDIDHVVPKDMQPLRERILAKKDELGPFLRNEDLLFRQMTVPKRQVHGEDATLRVLTAGSLYGTMMHLNHHLTEVQTDTRSLDMQ